MPKEFLKAVKAGAKVRTIKPTKDTYLHIAITKSGKTIAGEAKKVKKK